ncbi:hypothetical protein LSAT2_024245 [Lamellibrachia satsuma]|nr:hypothetical protein LSAT2_024245 [Lamellibrachia satsuma]
MPEGKRKVGRPKTTWRSTVENERRVLGLNCWNEARCIAAGRVNCRRCTSALWATGPKENRATEGDNKDVFHACPRNQIIYRIVDNYVISVSSKTTLIVH